MSEIQLCARCAGTGTERTLKMSDLQVDDYVTLPKNAQGTVWEAGVIEVIRSQETVIIGYGGKETLHSFRCHSALGYEYLRDIAEVWRKKRVVKHSSLEFEGKTLKVTSSEYEWERIR